LLKSDYPHYKFRGEFYRLFKNPDKAFVAMIYGKPGNGKSTFAIQFADYLAKNFGKVLYASNEEFKEYEKASKSLQDNLVLNGVDSDDIKWTKDLNGLDLNKYNFVFVDSVQSVGLEIKDFEQIKHNYANTAFILIFQVNKGGVFSGNNGWRHLVDAVLEVNDFTTYNQKRYAGEANKDEPVEIKGLNKRR
jgi:predicted ATP-dependent serine protease